MESLLEIAVDLEGGAVLELLEHFSEMVVLGVANVDGVFVADTKSSFDDLP